MSLARGFTCVKCGNVANQDQIINNRLLGRGTRCNNCINAIRRIRREQDCVTTKLNNLYSGAKRRSIQRGLEFDLTLNYLRSLVVWRCPALGVPLDWSLRGASNTGPYSPSLDRIDSDKGYTKSNVVIISRRANTIKNDANAKELLRIGKWLETAVTTEHKKERPSSLTDLQKKQIAELRQRGMTYRHMAEAVNCSKSTVGYILKK